MTPTGEPETNVFLGAAGFEQVKPAWREITRRPGVTPFQTVEWAEAWLAGAAPGSEPCVLAVGDPIEAILPLVLDRSRGIRRLRLLGHGFSDYLGPVPTSPARAIVRAMGLRLQTESTRFDLLNLQALHGSSEDWEVLEAELNGAPLRRVYEQCPLIDTDCEWESFLAGRSKKFRANLKRAVRRTESWGAVSNGIEPATPALFEEMIAVERASWKWQEGFAYLREPRTREFLRRILFDSNLEAELWTCRIDERLASFAVVFPRSDVRYYYLPSFRSEFPDTGSFLLGQIVRASCGSHHTTVDLLQGNERYKSVWASGFREVQQIIAPGRGWRAALAMAGQRGRWRLAQSERLRDARKRALVWLQGTSRGR